MEQNTHFEKKYPLMNENLLNFNITGSIFLNLLLMRILFLYSLGSYCMPEEGIELTKASKLLSTDEVIYLTKLFAKQGVDKVRLTGGEPLLRKDIVEVCSE